MCALRQAENAEEGNTFLLCEPVRLSVVSKL